MLNKAFYRIIFWIFSLTILLQINCTSKMNTLDDYGNPIFHSIQIKEENYDNYGISANYYTVSNNIANPNSSVFVSRNPSIADIIHFATNLPSYFWIIHQNRVVVKTIGLYQKSESFSNVKWFLRVVDVKNKTQKDFPINVWMMHLTEHRFLEIAYGPKMLEQSLLGADERIVQALPPQDLNSPSAIGKQIYIILPYNYIYDKLLKFINKTQLYLPEVNIENVNYQDEPAKIPKPN